MLLIYLQADGAIFRQLQESSRPNPSDEILLGCIKGTITQKITASEDVSIIS